MGRRPNNLDRAHKKLSCCGLLRTPTPHDQIIGRNSLSPLSGYTMDSGLLEDAHGEDGAGGWQVARMQLPPAWVDLVDRVRTHVIMCMT